MKKAGFYLLYVLVLGLTIYLGLKLGQVLRHKSALTYNLVPSFLFNAIFSVLIGILLAIPEFISDFRKPGIWIVKWTKLIVVGLPAFFFTFINVIHLLALVQLTIIPSWILYLGNTAISGIILGYTVLSSFTKVQRYGEE